ncbi:MAG: peptidylprolyl isomerase [Candidatus Omnitrophica bacterium]|nr:peptidylprolyl isomerase [Candidatus Omnitrophota bacterium]
MKNKFKFLLFFLSIFILTSCDKIELFKPKPAEKKQEPIAATIVKGTIIARVNNQPITLEELNEEIDAVNALVPADSPQDKITTPQQKIDYLKDKLVRRMLLYQEALTRGLDRKEDILLALEKTKQDLLVMELLRQEAEKIEVTSKEIEEFYNRYKEEMREPEERQVREIVVPTEQEAREILIQLLQGADFVSLARERSKATSAKEGGDLGYVTRGKRFTGFDEVVFSDTLELGKFSTILKGPDGYYIVKLEAKRGGKLRSVVEMWDEIKRGITFLKQQQKIDDLIGKLSSQGKIEVYQGAVK